LILKPQEMGSERDKRKHDPSELEPGNLFPICGRSLGKISPERNIGPNVGVSLAATLEFFKAKKGPVAHTLEKAQLPMPLLSVDDRSLWETCYISHLAPEQWHVQVFQPYSVRWNVNFHYI
jgi:hypothetical protein